MESAAFCHEVLESLISKAVAKIFLTYQPSVLSERLDVKLPRLLKTTAWLIALCCFGFETFIRMEGSFCFYFPRFTLVLLAFSISFCFGDEDVWKTSCWSIVVNIYLALCSH